METRSLRRLALALVIAGLALFGGLHQAAQPVAHAGHTFVASEGGNPTFPPPP